MCSFPGPHALFYRAIVVPPSIVLCSYSHPQPSMSAKKIIGLSIDDVEHQTPIGTRREPPERFVDTEEYVALL